MTQNIEAIATVIQAKTTIRKHTSLTSRLREKAVTDVIAYLQSHDNVSQVEALVMARPSISPGNQELLRHYIKTM